MSAGPSNLPRALRVSCDSLVALSPLTGGAAVFAKNSDRPANECQPLLQAFAADHPPGSYLRCQYVTIDQAAHTHAFIGSRPYWLWGVEHGLNEHGVAIGNHTIFTKDPVADVGLLGMDLVRLGLERGASAREAIAVIVELIERHGQGGSGYADTVWPYHNSFLVADAREAFLLEASSKNWALKAVEKGASASNHVTIGADWSRISAECDRHARDQGWCDGGGRLDFAAAYRDTTVAPPIVSSARYAATCAALARPQARFDAASLARVMRDHDGRETYARNFSPDDERYYSVCMHADPVGTTTASMIVELGDPIAMQPLWVAFCNPCIAPYLPVFLAGRVPGDLERGGADAGSGGAWWRFKRLLAAAEADWPGHAETIHAWWRPYEGELRTAVAELLRSDDVLDPKHRERALTSFMQSVWEETCERADALERKLVSCA